MLMYSISRIAEARNMYLAGYRSFLFTKLSRFQRIRYFGIFFKLKQGTITFIYYLQKLPTSRID